MPPSPVVMVRVGAVIGVAVLLVTLGLVARTVPASASGVARNYSSSQLIAANGW